MLICNVVGARPNFMKVAPIVRELQRREVPQFLVHTGQHYDANMSQVFFDELGMPAPDLHLRVGSGTHAEQTARVMIAFEQVCFERRPNVVLAGGDVNSTLAAALVAAKLNIPFAHVEAGLRSFDRTMPEEINRVVADHVSHWLFTSEESGNRNLRAEGIDPARIHFVGNCMIDTLVRCREAAVRRRPWEAFGLAPEGYLLATLHRPSNVDEREALGRLMAVFNQIARHTPLVFPIHPRTRSRLTEWRIDVGENIYVCEPMSYLQFLGMMARAQCVLTDSGGVQEETTALGVPCLTLRGNTERPVTLEQGTARLVGADPTKILSAMADVREGRWRRGRLPELWDGGAAPRIVRILLGEGASGQ